MFKFTVLPPGGDDLAEGRGDGMADVAAISGPLQFSKATDHAGASNA